MRSYDIDIERAVLGGLIAFESLQEEILTLEEGDFAFTEHQKLFSVMQKLYRDNGRLDCVSIAASSKEDLKQVITDCSCGVVTATTFSEHKKILKEMASCRRLNEHIEKLRYEGNMSLINLENIIEDERLRKLCDDFKKQNCENATRFISGILNKAELLKTGFPLLDFTLGGLRKGTLFTVGARPSVGKTTFAINVAKNVYEQGEKVMFFSLEMSAEMIYERLFANELNIDYHSLVLKDIGGNHIKKAGDYLNKSKDKLFILDDIYNVEQLCNAIMEEKPTLAVIDFMQIISTTDTFLDVRQKIDHISAMLKRTAKATGTVIMVLSQLTRSGREAPTMSDLKESGGLEQDGDYIALLHRPYVLKKDPENSPGATELLLDKNKFGATGKINLQFDLIHQRFSETA